jgi:AraC-like DNA-binding protein
MPADVCEFDRIVFESPLVRVSAFRCEASHPRFRDSGPARNFCFVFPRTAVEIQHEHERAFVANPHVATFYNKGQAYLRKAIGAEADRCDWFGVDPQVVLDVVRAFDPAADERPEMPFRFSHCDADAGTYLLQRRIFQRAAADETMATEELVLQLLERVVRSCYRGAAAITGQVKSRDREVAHFVQALLSEEGSEQLGLPQIARQTGMTVYGLCRLFRRATGTTMHQYRKRLRLRQSLERVVESESPLVDIALEAGFCSHSHYTAGFHREFRETPSAVRARRAIF